MRGYDICKKAFLRLGFHGEICVSSHNNDSLRNLEFVNQIAEDLSIKPLKELSDEIICTKQEADALCSGVTMLLSLSEGETEKNQIYTAMYNAKRAAVLGKISKIEDTLPTTESGDI